MFTLDSLRLAMFTLPEEIYLLALNDEKGKVHPSAAAGLRIGLAGSILTEFAVLGIIREDTRGRLVTDPDKSGNNALVDGLLKIFDKESHPKKVDYWLDAYSYHNKIVRKSILDLLVAHKVVDIDKKKIHLVTPFLAKPDKEANAKYWVKLPLRSAILGGEIPSSRTELLLAILNNVGLLDLVFTKDERKSAVNRVEDLIQERIPKLEQAGLYLGILTAMKNK